MIGRNLIRLICYLHGTPELALTLRADEAIMIRWWLDGSFAVCPNMRGHLVDVFLLDPVL